MADICNLNHVMFILSLLYIGIIVNVHSEEPSTTTGSPPVISTQTAAKSSSNKLDILYAVNCGGNEHVDHFGVPYQADPSKDGVASDYGLHWQSITNSHADDYILYQTERYAESTFGYDIPIPKQHKATNFVLVLKFAEVYFNQPQMKVFDILLNNDHLIVDGLDIFERAGGRAAAYDVHVPFRITGNKLVLTHTGEESEYSGSLRLDFVKTSQDNPKCNAFYVARGSLEDIPKFEPQTRPHINHDEDLLESDKYDDFDNKLRKKHFPDDANEDNSNWSPMVDFPTPSPLVTEEVHEGLALDKYYPVILVFMAVALLTAILFKL